jgi:hypothetical protein
MKRLFGSLAVVLTMCFTGCAEDRTVYVNQPAGPGSSTDGGSLEDATTEAGVPVLSPKAECERYLSCVNQSTPGGGGAAVALYGDASPCWKGSSADAQQCGDACRAARVGVANEGTKAPACGCTSDAECPKSFCGAEGACASDEWGAALTECKAVEAKSLAPPAGQLPPSVTCWAVQALRCDGIKTLRYEGGSRKDSKGESVYESALRRIYKCGLAADASLSLTGSVSGTDLPADAPAACKTAQYVPLLRIACNEDVRSVDLLALHTN